MKKFFKKMSEIFGNKTIRNKILISLALLAVYRLLVFIPIPFADLGTLLSQTLGTSNSDYGNFMMLLGGALDQFSFIAIGISPYITASIILQLAGVVFQGIGAVYLVNSMLGGGVIETSFANVMLSAFVMMVGSIMLMWIGELITSKGISNGISLLIFSSIVAGITQQLYGSFATTANI